jgi:hypothetical protein
MEKITFLRLLAGCLLVQVFTGFLPAPPPVAQKPAEIKWQKIDEGLETAEIISP